MPKVSVLRVPRAVARRARSAAGEGRLAARALVVRRRRRGAGRPPAADAWLLRRADAILTRAPRGTVVVLTVPSATGPDAGDAVARLLASGHPGARVLAEPVEDDRLSLHARLAAVAPVRALLVPAATSAAVGDLAELYRTTFWHLGRGGEFLISDLRADQPEPAGLWPLLNRMVVFGQNPELATPFQQHLSRATHRLEIDGPRAAITRAGPFGLAKIREAEIDEVIRRRGGAEGFVLHRRPAECYRARGVIRDHGVDTVRREPTEQRVPALSVRVYPGAVVAPRQITATGSLLLPDTYRHHLWPQLATQGTTDLAPMVAQVHRGWRRNRPAARKPLNLDRVERTAGSVFQFDNEWSGHFGHLLTEQVARLWGWQQARARYPDLQPLVFKQHPSHPLAASESGVLAAFGIDPAEVRVISAPQRPDRVVAATPMFSMPDYVSPGIVEVWDELGRGAERLAGAADRPHRIFVGRRATTRAHEGRRCDNADELEGLFGEAGFTVVYPQDHSFVEQVMLFRAAEVVAGYAGSGMFTMMACDEPKRVLLSCSEGYVPHNERMISGVRGNELDIFWSVPNSAALNAAYRFDHDREGRHLRRVLAELG